MLSFSVLACTSPAQPPAPARVKPVDPALAGMDPGIAPGDDFFGYANGGWLATTEIPKDRSTYGSTEALMELTQTRTADLIRGIAKAGPAADSEPKKIADAYASFTDEATVEARGAGPLKPTLDRILALNDKKALARYLGGTLRADVDVLNATALATPNVLGVWVAQDLDDPSKYAPFFLQGGLGLPDRGYYLDDTPHMKDVRDRYRTHVAAALVLVDIRDVTAKTDRIFALEKKIAESHASVEDTLDAKRGDNHWSRKDLETKAPGLDWAAFLGAAQLDHQPTFVVWHPRAVTALAALVASEPLDTWKEYLAFHAIDRAAPFLSRPFVDEDFAFHHQTLHGTEQLSERWKRGIDFTSEILGEAVGKLYAERWFPAAEKARVTAMVENVRAAFARRIDALTWMSPSTKARAKAKLAALKIGVGYPDHFRDYAALEIKKDDLFGNAQRAELFEYRRNLAKLGKPIDRDEWVMTPQTVNAVNLPVMIALNFPAAILQPPFLDPHRPEVMDYAATGGTIGHEISHAFDNLGALFDENGKLSNWWTDQDRAHFEASGAALARQFDGYRPFPDVAVNGKQTLGENIADLAGLDAAYDAYRTSLHGQPAPSAYGLTGDQLFFFAYSASWRTKEREATLRDQLLTNEHAPARYRADIVRNLDAWYPAFDVKPGQKLFLAPADRVRVW